MKDSKRILTLGFCGIVAVSILVNICAPIAAYTPVWGEDEEQGAEGQFILVNAAQDDVFTKLEEAAELNAIASNIIYCFAKDEYDMRSAEWNASTLEQVRKGDITRSGGTLTLFGILPIKDFGRKTSPLWLENIIKRQGRASVKGWFKCSDGRDIKDEEWAKWSGIFPVYMAYIGRHNDYESLYSIKDKIDPHMDTRPGLIARYMEHPRVPQRYIDWQDSDRYNFDPKIELQGLSDEDPEFWQKLPPLSELEYFAKKWGYYDEDEDEDDPYDRYAAYFSALTEGDVQYYANWFTDPSWYFVLRDSYNIYAENSEQRQDYGGLFGGNQYIIAWNQLGHYTNVDGYFNYMRDFNLRCRATKKHETNPNPEGSSYDPNGSDNVIPEVTNYSKSADGLRITAFTRWYEVRDNSKWEGSLGEYETNSCIKLLKRMETLRNHPNGEDYIYKDNPDFNTMIGDTRNYGYEGIILSILQDACDRMKDQKTGRNAWDVAYEELTKFLARTDIAEDDPMRITAQSDLEKLMKYRAMNPPHYMEASGEEHETTGRVYQCLQLETMDIDLAAYHPAGDIIPTPDEDEWQKEPSCYSNAGPLGWILCPIIEAMRSFILTNYARWVEPALQMDATLFQAGDDNPINGTYQAWAVFRDIGNFVFIGMFIIVIFSQITGAGIDNYGIKKALPKLIIAAITINLSFLICQISIDVCNIAGRQVGGFLQSATDIVGRPTELYIEGTTVRQNDPDSWKDPDTTWGDNFNENGLSNSILIIVVAAIAIGAVLSKGLAIIIPVLMTLLSVVISVIGLIVILGIRQAAAVLLVVASPLAFACYMLPNSKSLFDKWFNAFKGLLVAYPVCSLVVYGSNLAAAILINSASGHTWVAISAAVISIMPIFVIPKVIKDSVGAISNGIAKFSNRAGKYATGKARPRLEASKMGDRDRYSKYMRQQKINAKATKYNARRGQALLNSKRYNPKNKVLSPAKRRVAHAAQAAVNAQNRTMAMATESAFSGKTDAQIINELTTASSKGKLDANTLASGIKSLKSEKEVTNLMNKFKDDKNFNDMIRKDANARSSIGGALAGRRGSVINQAMGKLINQGKGVDDMCANNSSLLREKVQGIGIGSMANQSKETFETEGAAGLLSDDQIMAAATAGYSGEVAQSFHGMMSGVSQDRKYGIISKMEAGHIAKVNTAVGEDGKDYGSMCALGGPEAFARANKGELRVLASSAGDELRAGMQGSVVSALKLEEIAKEMAAAKSKSQSISGDIDLNNMTEDDYNYIVWQHDRNSGNKPDSNA
ncbi:hypothetical protein IJM16_03560 [Candidatus Saccharibacteria bacterium]|nr:hypothetical protein [Candidatus Saccharibacteria bacterium]